MASREHIQQLRRAQDHLQAGRLDEAEPICRDLIDRRSRDVDARYFLGAVLLARGRYDQAAEQFRQCLKIRPNDARYHTSLGNALAALGGYQKAMRSYDAAIKADPNYKAALAGKADALDRQGDPESALALLEPVVEEQADDTNVATEFASLALSAGRTQEAVDVVQRHLDDDNVWGRARRRLCFTLAKAYERLGRYEDALRACSEGHELLRQPFKRQDHAVRLKALKQTFTRERMQQLPRSRHDSEAPVFIVGMPRSGSTLCEQIIGAHPKAYAAGELSVLPDLVRDLLKRMKLLTFDSQCLDKLNRNLIDRTAKAYLKDVTSLRPGAERVVDKMLYNYEHLWLINLMFPSARVIHMKRDPLDNCLSCYTQLLPPFNHPYLSSFENLAFVYREYERLMEHWSRALDLPILEVQYESLVSDQERTSRQIIEFCGLPWHHRCLQFHKHGDVARTASYDQVRRPMYGSSVGRAERFGEALTPLREALARHA